MGTDNGLQRKTQCAIRGWYGRRIRDVSPTAVPGLVVANFRSYFHNTIYSVTHRRSGMRVGDFWNSAEEAQDFAEALGIWTEDWPRFWTLSGEEMEAKPDAVNHVRRCLGKAEDNAQADYL